MNKQILKKLSAVALVVAMLQGVALTSAISYSATETEQVEVSTSNKTYFYSRDIPKGVMTRYEFIPLTYVGNMLHEYQFVECEFYQSGDYNYYITDDGKGAVISGLYIGGEGWRFGYMGDNTDVVIPSEIDGLPVVELGHYAFVNCQNLHSVFVPSSVKTIDTYAFSGVNRGLRIQFSEGLEKIGASAFKFSTDTTRLDSTKVVIPSSVKTLGTHIFDHYGHNALVFSKNSQLNEVVFYKNGYVSSFEYSGKNFDVLVPDDFNMTDALPSRRYAISDLAIDTVIYYTDKNKTMVEYANSDDAIKKEKTLVKLEITDKNVSLKTNEEYELKSNLRQQSLIDCCTWESSDTSVATVDEKGKVTAVGVGTATITMTTENEMQASCTVNVSNNESDLAITKSNLKVGLNQKYRLKLNQTDVKGTWSSSDTSVATVNKGGNVTSVGVGKTNIIFTSETGERTVCVVEVVEGRLSDLGLNASTKTKFKINGVGRYYSLMPSKNTQITALTWKSTDEKVVTVNKNGNVKSVGVGTANIVVTDAFGQTKTYKFTVC